MSPLRSRVEQSVATPGEVWSQEDALKPRDARKTKRKTERNQDQSVFDFVRVARSRRPVARRDRAAIARTRQTIAATALRSTSPPSSGAAGSGPGANQFVHIWRHRKGSCNAARAITPGRRLRSTTRCSGVSASRRRVPGGVPILTCGLPT